MEAPTVDRVQRVPFEAPTSAGPIAGWVAGHGPRVLLLHGGPGLGFEYLDPLADELAESCTVASFQQRGLPPSSMDGPFTIDRGLADAVAVLDHLGWQRALAVGHSWGGHLALHLAAALGDRLDGALCVDAVGGVGDGGQAEFVTCMRDRLPPEHLARALELDEREEAGTLTDAEREEGLDLYWPSYFPTPEVAPARPPLRLSEPVFTDLVADLAHRLPALEERLPSVTVPLGMLAGAGSPIPASASVATAERVPGAWCEVVAGAGHFLWYEAPGAARAAALRLAAGASGQPEGTPPAAARTPR